MITPHPTQKNTKKTKHFEGPHWWGPRAQELRLLSAYQSSSQGNHVPSDLVPNVTECLSAFGDALWSSIT
jgi:hypothetical protein